MKVTIRDLARLLNVSETTVSLAFQNNSPISDKTRQRVLEKAKELDYIPNLAARRLRRGHTKNKIIGFLVNDITHPFYSLMVRAAQTIAMSHGYTILVADSCWQADKELAGIEYLLESRVDGILACLCERTPESLRLLERFLVPYILLDTVPSDYTKAFVANDLVEAARLAAKHLTQDVGCRYPVFLTADRDMEHFSAFDILGREFACSIREQGLPFDAKQIIYAGLTIAAGQAAFGRVLETIPEVDGIFCINSLCALGVIEAADQLGIQVGRDVAVMGVEDLDILHLSRISLTSIRQPFDQLAEMATTMLIHAIENKSQPSVQVSLKPSMIVRDSTKSKQKPDLKSVARRK